MTTPVLLRHSLDGAGLSAAAREGCAALLSEAHAALDDAGVPQDGRRQWFAPGRIEVLGKHVDYAGGRSLLCNVERGLVLVARPRNDRQLVLRDARRGEAVALALDSGNRGSVPWAIYPRTVATRLLRNFGPQLRGADVALASNLPPAAGVSSSSALTVGLTLALSGLSELPDTALWREALPTREQLAGYIGAIENGHDFGGLAGERGVGTMGGAQDQTAILCSAPDALRVFAWAPVQYEREVPLPSDLRFVIAVSGVVAAKTGAARERYNRAARTAQHLVRAWNVARPVGSSEAQVLRQAFEAAWRAEGRDPSTLQPELPSTLVDAARRAATIEFPERHLVSRLEQFFDETWHYVPGAADALAAHDLETLGRLVDRSQAGAERALENQVAETVHLQRYARELGAHAASAFGAGFGGSVWALVPEAECARFVSRWREKYRRAHPTAGGRAQFFVTAASVPAFEVY
ncbi:MAG: galactokinase [Gemmatimonadaceae bacterium]|nr:galactokinase [Gemmatimonadaceae bacterium]